MLRSVFVALAVVVLASVGAVVLPAHAQSVSATVCYSVSASVDGQSVATGDCVAQTAP